MSTHSNNRKFERLIGSFPGNCQYDGTLATEGRYQADLEQRSKSRNIIDEASSELITVARVTRYLDKGETVIKYPDQNGKFEGE